MTLQQQIGKNIRDMRKEKGIRIQIFFCLGVRRMYKIERGELNPDIHTLYAIAQHLDCEVRDLLPDMREIGGSFFYERKAYIKPKIDSQKKNAKTLYRARMKLGVTQEHFCKQIGLKYHNYSRMERGLTPIPQKAIEKAKSLLS